MSVEQYAMRAFADALDAVPTALAENSGLPPIETVADISAAAQGEDPVLGRLQGSRHERHEVSGRLRDFDR